jgi:hypothetical protein
MNKEQIKHMVDRFLWWKLPEHFSPDNGISFDPVSSKGTAHESRREPVGTNLFSAAEATAMVRHMVEGLPGEVTYSPERIDRWIKIELAAMQLSTAMVEAEATNANFDSVDSQWVALTVALQPLT